LSNKVSSRIDAEDVVQSAYRSFFASIQDGRYTLDRGGDVWQLLVAITLHKLHDQVRWHMADKRAVGSEDSLLGIQPALGREPSPEEALVLRQRQAQHLVKFRIEALSEQNVIGAIQMQYSTRSTSGCAGHSRRSCEAISSTSI
jgi:hypothetical protein